MDGERLKTAVLGLDERGLVLLKAASVIEHFHLVAVADRDTELVEKTAGEFACTAFDDYRQLIIQNQLDCLLVAAGMYSCDEYVRAAIKKKFNVLKLAPLARNFAEAVEFVRLAESQEVKFAVANPDRFAESFVALKKYMEQNRPEQIFLITAFCGLAGESFPAWQNDPKLSGGGVLLRNCYQMIDDIIQNFKVPEQVYSLNTNTAPDRQQRQYLTEDTVVVSMRFSDTLIANLIASRHISSDKEKQSLKIYSKDKVLSLSDACFGVFDVSGGKWKRRRFHDDEISRLTGVLNNFALSIISPEENMLCSGARENLAAMAVIESAYLSARTAMPEEPARILKMGQAETA